MWDLRSARPPKRLAGPKGSYEGVQYLADGSLALNSFRRLFIYRPDLSDHREQKGPPFPVSPDVPKWLGKSLSQNNQIRILPDGKTALSSEIMGGSTMLWDIATGKVIGKVSGPSFGQPLFTKNGGQRDSAEFWAGSPN